MELCDGALGLHQRSQLILGSSHQATNRLPLRQAISNGTVSIHVDLHDFSQAYVRFILRPEDWRYDLHLVSLLCN